MREVGGIWCFNVREGGKEELEEDCDVYGRSMREREAEASLLRARGHRFRLT